MRAGLLCFFAVKILYYQLFLIVSGVCKNSQVCQYRILRDLYCYYSVLTAYKFIQKQKLLVDILKYLTPLVWDSSVFLQTIRHANNTLVLRINVSCINGKVSCIIGKQTIEKHLHFNLGYTKEVPDTQEEVIKTLHCVAICNKELKMSSGSWNYDRTVQQLFQKSAIILLVVACNR